MRKIALLLTLVLVVGLFAGCNNKGDQIVFESGDVTVTYGELEFFFYQSKSYYENELQYTAETWASPVDSTDEESKTYNQAALDTLRDQLIQLKMAEQMAKERNLTISDEVMAEIEANAQATVDSYKANPESVSPNYELTYDNLVDMNQKIEYYNLLFEDMKEELEIDQDFVDMLLTSQPGYAEIKEMGVDAYSDQVRARHILISTLDENGVKLENDALAEKRNQIEEIYEMAVAGDDFAELAKLFSEDPGSKDNGGEYTFGRGQMVDIFEETAYALEEGEISDIIETTYGFHIIKLEEYIPATEDMILVTENTLSSWEEQAEAYAYETAFGTKMQTEFEAMEYTTNEELWAEFDFSK
jgi:parvulin-like peptidyl-prolyl isomerase